MQRITNIRGFFIIILLVVAMACQQTTDPATEPGKEVEAAAAQAPVDPADDLPESVRMLAPEYHQAYRLLPDGPWVRKYIALRLDAIESIDWERLKASYSGPYPQPVPEMDPGEEFQLRRVLTNAGDEEWLIRKVRSLDADAARQFEATQDMTERLETLRRLVEVEGKEQGVLEIEMEWQMRLVGRSEAEIARFLERERNSLALSEARRQWTPDEQRTGNTEITVCNAVMNFVVGENPGVYLPDGRCDIAKVLVMTKEALDAKDGRALYTEDDFREMVEYAQQNPGMWLHVSPSGAARAPADLPDAVSILSDEYHEAYRLLPSDDHSLERIEAEFAGFDLERWQAFEWNTEGYDAAPPSLNMGSVLPMLQSAAGRIEDRQWVAARIRAFEPGSADRFLAGKDVFELAAILKELVEERGFYREVEEVSLRFGGMKAGDSQEFIDKVVKQHFAFTDYLEARGKLGFKEQAVLENEVSVCVLLMELMVGADPFTTIVDGRCDIIRALDMAKPSTS